MSTSLESMPESLTVDEAAEFLRLNRKTVYEAIRRKEIPHRKIGRSIRLSRQVLVDWLGDKRLNTESE